MQNGDKNSEGKPRPSSQRTMIDDSVMQRMAKEGKSPMSDKTSARGPVLEKSRVTSGVPNKIGKYINIEPLAEGGMGAVYKAFDPEFGRTVVLKRLKVNKANETQRDRFIREAAILATLTSQHIVRGFETISENGSDYFVLEYVEGMSLDKVIEKLGRLPPQIAMWIFYEACKGLDIAHHEEIVHRDIKPANILIEKGMHVKLADFGISGEAKEEDVSEEEKKLEELNDTLSKLQKKLQEYNEKEKDLKTQWKSLSAEKKKAAKEKMDANEQKIREVKKSLKDKIDITSNRIEELKASGNKSMAMDLKKVKKIKISKVGALNKDVTKAGAMLGTPVYMSSEQLLKSALLDKRTDIFSMGVMLYEMLTGERPFNGEDIGEQLYLIKKGKYRKIRSVVKGTPKICDRLVKKMVSYDPKNRYQSISEVKQKVSSYLKAYDETEIRQELANRLYGQNYTPKDIASVNRKRNLFLKIAIPVLALGACIFTLFYTGIAQKYVFKKWYVPVSVNLRVPENLEIPKELRSRVYFYKKKADSTSELFTKRRRFPTTVQEDGSVVTRPVYFRKGAYRLKLLAGPFVSIKDFSVGSSPLTLDCDFSEATDRLVSFHVSAVDIETGEDLSSKVIFELGNGDERTKLSGTKSVSLKSGAIFDAYLNCKGYDEEHYSVEIGFYQNDIYINAEMRKSTEEKK